MALYNYRVEVLPHKEFFYRSKSMDFLITLGLHVNLDWTGQPVGTTCLTSRPLFRTLRVYARILRSTVRTSDRHSGNSEYLSEYSGHTFGHPVTISEALGIYPNTPAMYAGPCQTGYSTQTGQTVVDAH